MAVIDRDLHMPDVESLTVEPPTTKADRATRWSRPGMLLLAALSAAAGVIHLVMVPSHMAESSIEGIGFAVAGWLQLIFALSLVLAPSRVLLQSMIVANVAFIVAWIVSRTAGLPVGPNSGHAESVGFVDATCVALEALLIVAAGVLLTRPSLGSELRGPRLGIAAIVPIGILALATTAVASPSARNHAAHGHGDMAAAAHHDSTGAADHHATGAADDLGLGMLQNGHHAEMEYKKLSPADQAKVDELLAVSRDVARKYPTLGIAIDAGARRAGPFAPGLGIHYTAPWLGQGFNPDGVMDKNDMAHPMMFIYDGTDRSAKMAGFMYYSTSANEPAGLPGQNDFWHYHTNVCLKPAADGIDAPLGADRSVAPNMCTALGGSTMAKTQWMVHVWTAPGYEVSQSNGGTFAEANPKIKCADGTYYMMDIAQMPAYPLNVCKSELG
jgi:hypothetical protein